MKKKYKAVICFLIMTFLIVPKMNILAAELETESTSTVTTQSYNVMLLIDKSGSMNSTDQDNVTLDAAEQFIDQLSITYNDLSRATNVGLMTFNQTTELLYAPAGLDNESNVKLLKAAISCIEYDAKYTGGTDLGIAVYNAVKVLQKQAAKDSKNLIVMFTDGYSQRVLNMQTSQKRLNDAFAIAEEMGCEIFIVGMNHDNSIESEGREEIYRIANTTQLEDGIEDAENDDKEKRWENVNYLITDDINSVREFYGKIYARMIGGGLEFLAHHQFAITTGGIREVDVTVYSGSEITEVTMLDPDGNKMREDGERYFVYGDEDSLYKVIKLLDPEMGIWTVEVKSADEDKAYVIRFYGIEMAISATWGAQEEFENSNINDFATANVGQVLITPMYKTEQYKDDSFAESLDVARFIVSKGDDLETYSLTYNAESGQFVGYFPVDDGKYHISAVLSNETMFRKAECDLNVNFIDDAEVMADDGYDEMKTEPIDETGGKDGITGKIDVGFTLLKDHLLMVIAGILLIVSLLYIIVKRMTYIPGNFVVYIDNLNTDTNIERTISRHPKGKKFSLWKLIEYIVRDYVENPSEEERDLRRMLEEEKGEIILRKIIICKRGSSKRKVYKLNDAEGHLLDLSGKTVGYQSDSIKIKIEFRRLEEDDGGWGQLVDDKPSKNKKYRRTPGK